MKKKQTKPKYPKELYVINGSGGCSDKPVFMLAHDSPAHMEGEVAIYQFVRLAKVKRTVTVE